MLPSMILRQFPPMGVYETLFKFVDATHKYMGRTDAAPSALERYARFSFGPLRAESYDDDMRILREWLQ